MSNIEHRLSGEGGAQPEKENAPAGNQGAEHNNQTDHDSTVEHSRETERERGEYLPLAWARLGGAVEPQQFKGKTKRKSRQAAIQAKRGMSGGALIEALAYLALGAWAAAVVLWLLEVLP
ncbi:hypothetical protein [Thauera aminoaromatica]|uniref:hypothetical protein n=1 Tax=Thauera aminoaromatica TaxID=164330 RepID=UPI0002F2BD67|nr:hypothetical protein [Thauera aminoaromatica]